MRAKQLLEYLQSPQQLTADQVAELQALVMRYPYFQAAHALVAKAAYDKDTSTAGHAIQRAAMYATDRNHLRALLEDTPPFSVPPSPAMPRTSAQSTTAVTQAPKEEHFINGYVDKLHQQQARQITKEKVLAQLDLIQAFVDSDISFKPQFTQAPPSAESQVDLTKDTVQLHDDLLTENLAKILFRQGKVQQAIEIYDKLRLKYPEKSTYFASLSQELNTQA